MNFCLPLDNTMTMGQPHSQNDKDNPRPRGCAERV
jgi:hypothetical protein